MAFNYDNKGIKPQGGNTTFDRDIIFSVVSLATKEIAGVANLSKSFARKLCGWFSKDYDNGVRITNIDGKLIIDIYINVYIGYNISDVAFKVQENIKNSLSTMIDIEVSKINVHVISVEHMKDEED